MTCREMRRKLEILGCMSQRQAEGSHEMWVNPANGRRTLILSTITKAPVEDGGFALSLGGGALNYWCSRRWRLTPPTLGIIVGCHPALFKARQKSKVTPDPAPNRPRPLPESDKPGQYVVPRVQDSKPTLGGQRKAARNALKAEP